MKGALECKILKVGLVAKKGGTAEFFRPFKVIGLFLFIKLLGGKKIWWQKKLWIK